MYILLMRESHRLEGNVTGFRLLQSRIGYGAE